VVCCVVPLKSPHVIFVTNPSAATRYRSFAGTRFEFREGNIARLSTGASALAVVNYLFLRFTFSLFIFPYLKKSVEYVKTAVANEEK